MEFDFEKFFKYLAVENSLLVLGVSTFLISVYNEYILGMKLGFLFLLFGAILRFYRLSIVLGIFVNYLDKFRYKRETLVQSKEKGITKKSEEYVYPYEKSKHIYIADYIISMIILLLFVYIFISIID